MFYLLYSQRFGLPLAGHKDNHSGIMNIQQFKVYQDTMNIKEGKEWDKTQGIMYARKIFKIIYQIINFIKLQIIGLFKIRIIEFKKKDTNSKII